MSAKAFLLLRALLHRNPGANWRQQDLITGNEQGAKRAVAIRDLIRLGGPQGCG